MGAFPEESAVCFSIRGREPHTKTVNRKLVAVNCPEVRRAVPFARPLLRLRPSVAGRIREVVAFARPKSKERMAAQDLRRTHRLNGFGKRKYSGRALRAIDLVKRPIYSKHHRL